MALFLLRRFRNRLRVYLNLVHPKGGFTVRKQSLGPSQRTTETGTDLGVDVGVAVQTT